MKLLIQFLFSLKDKKSVLLFFIFKPQVEIVLNEKQYKEDRYFQGKSEDFIQGNQIQQGKGDPYHMYYCLWYYGACWDSDCY